MPQAGLFARKRNWSLWRTGSRGGHCDCGHACSRCGICRAGTGFVSEKIHGAELPLVRESDLPAGKQIRIYIGATKAAERAGLGQKTFSGESYAIKAVDGGLFIVGGENGKPLLYEPDAKRSKQENGRLIWTENGIVRDARRGTLYGVYRFLSTFSGIRWLWPGELGTYVPEKKVLAVDGDLNITGLRRFNTVNTESGRC